MAPISDILNYRYWYWRRYLQYRKIHLATRSIS